MSTQEAKGRLEFLEGTLDLLLGTRIVGSRHGQGIARHPTNEECWPNMERPILPSGGWRNAAGSPPNGNFRK